MKEFLDERKRGLEADYFRKQDAKLLEKMRERARLQDVTQALADKLRVDNAELLRRVVDLGLTRDTGSAILLAPLVQVAWAEGKVTDRERKVVFEVAASRGVESDSPAHAQLVQWLQERPSDALFETAMEVMKAGLSVLPPEERTERIHGIVEACSRVAEASGSGLANLLGVGSSIDTEESAILDAITSKLHTPAKPG